jgi:hypothetical protein
LLGADWLFLLLFMLFRSSVGVDYESQEEEEKEEENRPSM